MTEVFKTNVQLSQESEALIEQLRKQVSGGGRISFDLEDCDRILRIESCNVVPSRIVELLELRGYLCEILE